ncbi:hypothetical protein [Salibacter sp.]|uniref:hypothetical protein n=1 Tax=Salibacter sp. TaxID=2010995 RepID=UPI00286FB5CF|nr:hypothetical protein [Salibacter sp.]MDR9488676.1 hypothetical protein [Salibacter sp.]
MLVQFYIPKTLSGSDLDFYLSRGWFRNSLLLHHSEVICLDEKVQSIVNIRLPLNEYKSKRNFRKIRNRVVRNFEVVIRRSSLTKQKEDLYRHHKKRFKGFLFEDLDQFLMPGHTNTIFNTWEVEVYDGEKLIAYSLFDLGEESVASLIGIYDNDYSQYSLGTFTMIAEVEFAKKHGFTYYYPGYILDNSTEFDYKLRLGEMEYLNHQNVWRPLSELDKLKFPASKINAKMHELERALTDKKIPHIQRLNPFYTLGYIEPYTKTFTKSTVVFLIPGSIPGFFLMAEYHFEKKQFTAHIVRESPLKDSLLDMQITPELLDENTYLTQLYQFEQNLGSTPDARQMAQMLYEARL